MSTPNATPADPATAVEHVDVLFVGAGLSGIGAARHLQMGHPDRTFLLLEGRERSGGTWDLFRYPGIRSDSDLSTFAYDFKPWTGAKAIADGEDILAYLREAASETGVDQHIRYDHRVQHASFSTADARWTVRVLHAGEELELTCSWLFCASGYYRYDQGFSPTFAGAEDFAGQIIHPQLWPEDFDPEGKEIVVVGSGATAVTLVPALAKQGAHVTMLQRSPSYVLPLPSTDPIGDRFRTWFGDVRGHKLTRQKNIEQQRILYAFCQRFPGRARKWIRSINKKYLPEHVDVDVHFNPTYDPWDQRLCAVPHGDLFRAFQKRTADIVTDGIERFTEKGVLTTSGTEIPADVIVTATGLNLLLFGNMTLDVDGEPVDVPSTLAYKGFMGSGVPNFSFAIGYTNSSWTLKIDLVCRYLNRVLAHMDEHDFAIAVPVNDTPGMATKPLLDFKAGYVMRSLDQMPKQGADAPWQLAMSYREDEKHLRKGAVSDGVLRFARRGGSLPVSFAAGPIASTTAGTPAPTGAAAPADAQVAA
ncbi:flavin-containing monooxygenase [Patulibacter minatonensis]|uniref:flavin-containing monooxygenase n=1 Tax=Patulibacter minatonensis TaxID=298163 RepID=UPI00047D441F|nr:NAD(P)/FAD-dependent oxidoreductase [Patulibacter minatonensis]